MAPCMGQVLSERCALSDRCATGSSMTGWAHRVFTHYEYTVAPVCNPSTQEVKQKPHWCPSQD